MIRKKWKENYKFKCVYVKINLTTVSVRCDKNVQLIKNVESFQMKLPWDMNACV